MKKLSLTTPRQTVIAVLAGALLTGMGLFVYDKLAEFPPVVPWSVPVTLGVLGIAGIIYALLIPKRREERKLDAQEGFVAVVSGKAMIFTGAVIAGAHTVYVMKYLPAIEASTPAQRVLQGTATIVAAVLVALAGSMIEHRLVIQEPPAGSNEGRHGPEVEA